MSKWVGGAITIEGMDEVLRELQRRGVDVVKGAEQIFDAGAEVVQEGIRTRAPGRMASATTRETKVRGGTKIAVDVGVEKKLNYLARFLEFGTKAHAIEPRRRKRGRKAALSIPGIGVRRRVKHPGGRARPFIRPGFEATKGAATVAIGRKTKEVVRA